jgi:hypothetical protein
MTMSVTTGSGAMNESLVDKDGHNLTSKLGDTEAAKGLLLNNMDKQE